MRMIRSGVAVTCSHGNDQDVGSNPAVASKNENQTLGRPLPQKVA